jgi:TolB-like protein/Tfp pilus assembly protein PilF
MVTGRLPFEGDTPLSIAVKHKIEEPPDPRQFNSLISEVLCRVILKCMEKEKEKRYQGAEELLSELNEMERETPHPEKYITPRTPASEKMSTIKWKKILPYGGGAIILILLILIGLTYLPGRLGTIDSIAVLPFQNVDRYSYSEYLTDGITENIISKLAQLPGLKKVIARSSVFSYKGKEINPQVAGRELGVDAVFVSRMSRRGEELTISVELIRVRDNSRIWGKRYTCNISEIFAVQEEITNSITDNLRLRLTGAELERMKKRYTEKTEAFIAYTKGRFFWNKRTQADLERAIEYFEQALQIDPNYALAYTGLSFSYFLLPEYGTYRPKEVYPKSKEASLKALEIDDLLSEARVSLAQILRRFEYNWAGAEREYRRALELDPNNATAHHWYGYDLMCVGQFEKGIKEIRRALELDPLSLVINRNLGQALYRARRYDEALDILQKTLEMDPTFSATHLYIGSIYLQQGKYEDALAEFQKEKGNAKGWSMRLDAWIGVTYAKMGEEEKTRATLDDLLRKSEHMYVSHTLLAMLYFVLGEDGQGFQMLDRAYEEYDTWMRLIKTDPIFDSVRSDPRLKAILRKAGLED